MYRNHLIIILIHSLVFMAGCRNRVEKQSQVKEVPNSLKSFEGVFADETPEDRQVAKDFVGIIQELGLAAEGMPYVIVDHNVLRRIRSELKPYKYRLLPTMSQILGKTPLLEGQELYLGRVNSRFVTSMVIESVDRNKGEIVAKIYRFDTSGARTTGVFRKDEGEILRFSGVGNKYDLAEDVNDKMSKIKSFMTKPKAGDDAKLAAHRLHQLNLLNDEAKRQIDDGQRDVWAGIGALILAPLFIYGFTALMVGVSKATNVLFRTPWAILAGIVFMNIFLMAVNFNIIPGAANMYDGRRKVRELKTRLNERALYWGRQTEKSK